MELDIEKIGTLTLTQLCDDISYLIDNDFNSLMQLLYRIDVDETKLRTTILENQNRNSAEIIAALILDRLEQRNKMRAANKMDDKDIPDDEKW